MLRTQNSRLRYALTGLVLVVLLGGPIGLSAADPAFVGKLAIAVTPEGAKRLALSDEVKEKLLDLIDRRERDALKIALEIKDLPPDQRNARLAPFVAESERQGMALLSAEQKSQLERLSVAQAGMISLANAETAKALQLTDDQQAKIQELLSERAQAMTLGGERERRVARDEFERKLSAVLSPAQRATWEQLAGLAGAEDAEKAGTPKAGTDKEAGTDRASTDDKPAANDEPSTAEKPESARNRTDRATDKTADSPKAEASKEGRPKGEPVSPEKADKNDTPAESPSTDTPKSATSKSEAEESPAKSSAEKSKDRPATAADEPAKEPVEDTREWAEGELRLKFNFHHAPWKSVIEWFAEQADLALEAETYPTGTCNYKDSRSYTPQEAIDVLNRYLLIKGYVLIRNNRMLLLHNSEDPLPVQLIEVIPVEELDRRGEFELVKVLFPLSKMEPAEAQAEIQSLIGPNGNIAVLAKSRQLLVTETVGRLKTIRKIFDDVEKPADGRMESVKVIALKYVGVEDFLTVARPLLQIPDGQNTSTDLRLALDPFSPRIFVTGTPDAVRRLQDIVTEFDKPREGGDESPAKPLEQPQLETYPIAKADPDTVYKVLSTLLAGLPEVRLTVDPLNKKVILLARPTEHQTVIATLKQLEGNADTTEVIQLKHLDPQAAILLINKLLGSGNEKDSAVGPRVDADPTTMKLIVHGTQSQIDQVRNIIEKLEGPSTPGTLAERQNMRFLPLAGGSTKNTLDAVEQFFSMTHPNKIRMVTPSAISSGLNQQTPSRQLQVPTAIQGLEAPNTPVAPREISPSPDAGKLPPKAPLRKDSAPKPPAPPAKNPPKEKSAHSSGRASVFQFVGHKKSDGTAPQAETPSEKQPSPPASTKTDEASESSSVQSEETQPAVPARESQRPADEPSTDNTQTETPSAPGAPPEILVTVTPQGIFIASKDLDALDAYEKLLRDYIAARGVASGEPTVFWLKYEKAEVAAALLNQFLNGVPANSGGSGGSLLGDMANTFMGDQGGLLGAMLGLGGGGGGSSSVATGPTTIIPDVRLNALIVQGRAQDIMAIEQLLPIIDRESGPEDVMTTGMPRLITVINMAASDMADIVKDAFADRVISSNSNQRQQPNPEEFIRALRGGGRSRTEEKGEMAKMMIGVDNRSNSLVVTAPDALFKQVELLVQTLDQEGTQIDDSLATAKLSGGLNPETLIEVLTAITGGQVRTGNNQQGRNGSSSSSSSNNGGPSGGFGQPGQFGFPGGQPSPDDIRRRMEFMQRMGQGGGDSGQRSFSFGPGGGGPTRFFGGQGSGGGTPGGDSSRGSSSRGGNSSGSNSGRRGGGR